MSTGPDFTKTTVETLSKRAALRCSNPDCYCLTTGPHVVADKSTTIGEAAHIFGARAIAPRFRKEMSDQERSAISNAIWLCSNCHTLIDKDGQRFSPELLLAWRRSHETKVLNLLGTRGEELRLEVRNEAMKSFSNLPPHIRQVISDRPDLWEYMLTAEALDHFLAPVMRQAADLENGLVVRGITLLPPADFLRWVTNKMAELTRAVGALSNIIDEIQKSWGEPGQPGDVAAILHACELYAKCGRFFVEVSEEAVFTAAPAGFESVASLVGKGARYPVGRLPQIAEFIRGVLSKEDVSGQHAFSLVIDLPPGWTEDVQAALEEGRGVLAARGYSW